jgi:hypothetical protein
MWEWLKSLFTPKQPAPAIPPLPKKEEPAPVVVPPVVPPKKNNMLIASILTEANKHVGNHEQGGNNHGPQVKVYLGSLGMKEGAAWCMAFVQYIIRKVAKELGVTLTIARSAGCMDTWNKSPKDLRLTKPEVGSVVIWKHKTSVYGHTGIVIAVDGDDFTTIEGNTGPGAGIVREGDGVYIKKRSIRGDGDMKVVGFLKVV